MIAQQQMNRFSGMLIFNIQGNAKQWSERLRLFNHAYCLGREEYPIKIPDGYQRNAFSG